jgi:hypothetical protein
VQKDTEAFSAIMQPAAKRQRPAPVTRAAPTPANALKKPLELLFEEFRYVPKTEKTGAAGGRL